MRCTSVSRSRECTSTHKCGWKRSSVRCAPRTTSASAPSTSILITSTRLTEALCTTSSTLTLDGSPLLLWLTTNCLYTLTGARSWLRLLSSTWYVTRSQSSEGSKAQTTPSGPASFAIKTVKYPSAAPISKQVLPDLTHSFSHCCTERS